AVDAVTRGRTPDVIFMDMQMPILDGCEATGQIRQWEQEFHKPRLPIIALTAGAFAEDIRRCETAGMDDFLSKPVDALALADKLRKWAKDQPKSVLQESSPPDAPQTATL